MRWPDGHPALVDDALIPWTAGADELCPDAEVCTVLRYVSGRRVASLVRTHDDHLVLKVFSSPRARGNHRRLSQLAQSGAAPIAPRSLGCDRSGHVSLVRFTPGETYDQLDDDRFVAVAGGIGDALRRLHTADIAFDRSWTFDDEVTQLRRRMLPEMEAAVAEATRRWAGLADDALVTAHRDFHPRQVVVDGDHVRLVDLDDAANAPAGLDLGNFTAHLWCEAAKGRRSGDVCRRAIGSFLEGYGPLAEPVQHGLAGWEALALLRLASLATTRHGRPDWTENIKELVNR
ncbi:MAG: hypothetical protein AB7L13_10385 [Acidimicrobiia bacterium]